MVEQPAVEFCHTEVVRRQAGHLAVLMRALRYRTSHLPLHQEHQQAFTSSRAKTLLPACARGTETFKTPAAISALFLAEDTVTFV